MPIIILLIIAVITGGYFAFRYLTLLYALKQITDEVNDIHKDITQNQILHLPIPNRHLAELLAAFNVTLEEIQRERQKYEKREKEFQSQIENISHDLRTPLTVILGYLKFMKKSDCFQLQENKELTETVDIIENKAETLKDLVTKFYDFSRLNAGDYELPLSNVDISRILRESLMGNYQILEQAKLQLEINIPEYPIWVQGETLALERIFLNLFQNAGRYADTYLQLAIRESGQNIIVTFINDTQKLSEEDVPHLFERFYVQDLSRNQGGTGLGLAVAKALAESMDAELNAHIVDGKYKASAVESLNICFELDMHAI